MFGGYRVDLDQPGVRLLVTMGLAPKRFATLRAAWLAPERLIGCITLWAFSIGRSSDSPCFCCCGSLLFRA